MRTLRIEHTLHLSHLLYSLFTGKPPGFWRTWQPTPVFFPRESHGQRSLVGYGPWGCRESDTTELLSVFYQDIYFCWVLKNWCFWSVVLDKTLESPLDSKEIKPVNPKGNQPWIFIGRTDAEAPIRTNCNDQLFLMCQIKLFLKTGFWKKHSHQFFKLW